MRRVKKWKMYTMFMLFSIMQKILSQLKKSLSIHVGIVPTAMHGLLPFLVTTLFMQIFNQTNPISLSVGIKLCYCINHKALFLNNA